MMILMIAMVISKFQLQEQLDIRSFEVTNLQANLQGIPISLLLTFFNFLSKCCFSFVHPIDSYLTPTVL